ncbi:hypothetical protein BD770DRAFT_397761 [Pilaira anomala]|nr:hypothetical protein BD770DRAFT_397761 [Pilaira anomala]
MSYTLEYAKSDRSVCNGPKHTCPSKDHGISKGELRLGVEVTNIHGTKWRHWYCTTAKVIENMKSDFPDPSSINGWQDLREEDQERVQRAWDEGDIPENERPASAASNESNKRKEPATDETANKKEALKSAVKGTREKSGKQEVSIQEPSSKKSKMTPEEPKVASFATRNKKVSTDKKSKGEPTRRSGRLTGKKVEEPNEEPKKKQAPKKTEEPKKKETTIKKKEYSILSV